MHVPIWHLATGSGQQSTLQALDRHAGPPLLGDRELRTHTHTKSVALTSVCTHTPCQHAGAARTASQERGTLVETQRGSTEAQAINNEAGE